MKFNPSPNVRISSKSNFPNLTYYLLLSNKSAEHAKYLGVTIDQKLNWHEHISNVVKTKRKGTLFMAFYNGI